MRCVIKHIRRLTHLFTSKPAPTIEKPRYPPLKHFCPNPTTTGIMSVIVNNTLDVAA